MQQQQHIEPLPTILGIEELARILRKKPTTITVDLCRSPHRLPPPCTPPGQREQVWLAEDVLSWLKSFRRQQPAAEAAPPAPGRPGRPTKAAQIAARRAAERAAALVDGEGGAA